MTKNIIFFFISLYFNFSNAEEIQIGCKIYNNNGELIRLFNGYLCAFSNDGSYISYNQGVLSKLNKENKTVWKIQNVPIHHRITLSKDEKFLFALSEEEGTFLGQKTTFDNMITIDVKNGNIISKVNTKLKIKDFVSSGILLLDEINNYYYFKQRFSFGHFNSIFEIENNDLSKLNPNFKKGNLLINVGDSNGHIIVVDRISNEILWIFKTGYSFRFHDLKINHKNNFSIYQNSVSEDPSMFKTVLLEFNPLKNKHFFRTTELKINGKSFFQSKVGGFDYNLKGELLYSAYTTQDGYMLAKINKYNKPIFVIKPNHNQNNIGLEFQEAKYIEAKSFLRNNQAEF